MDQLFYNPPNKNKKWTQHGLNGLCVPSGLNGPIRMTLKWLRSGPTGHGWDEPIVKLDRLI